MPVKSSKKLSKSELKEDRFVEWIMDAVEYVQQRSQWFIGAVAGVILLVLAVNLFLRSQEKGRLEAANRLGEAMMAEGQGQDERAMQLYEDLARNYRGTEAGAQGMLMLANRHYNRGNYPEAQRLYQSVLDTSGDRELLQFAAWNGLAACLEAQGQFKQAGDKYREYASDHGKQQQAALALTSAARCYGLAGDLENQKQALEQITRDFSSSPLASQAGEAINLF